MSERNLSSPKSQLVKGSTPIDIRTAPVVQVAVNLDISLDDFFDPNDLISRLAFVLKIDHQCCQVSHNNPQFPFMCLLHIEHVHVQCHV